MKPYYNLGKLPIYLQHTQASEQIRDAFMEGDRRCLLTSMGVQAGKTPTMASLASMLRKYDSNILNVFFCNLPYTSLKIQTTEECIKAFTEEEVVDTSLIEHVSMDGKILVLTYPDFIHSNVGQEILNWRSEGKSINLMMDEWQYALKADGKIESILNNSFGIDLTKHHSEWQNKNIYFTAVTATPNQEALAEIEDSKNKIVVLQVGEGYTGPREILDSDRFIDIDHKEYFNSKRDATTEWYKGEVEEICKQNKKAYIIQRETSAKLVDLAQKEWEKYPNVQVNRVGSAGSKKQPNMKPDDAKRLLKKEPKGLTVLFVDLAFGAGDTLGDKYTAAYFEKKGDAVHGETYTQRMRFAGYNKNQKCKIYASGSLLKQAQECFDSMEQAAIQKIKVQSSTYTTSSFSKKTFYDLRLTNKKPDNQNKTIRAVSTNIKNDLAKDWLRGKWRSSEDSYGKIDAASPEYNSSYEELINAISKGDFKKDNGEVATLEDLKNGYCYIHPVNRHTDWENKEAHIKKNGMLNEARTV